MGKENAEHLRNALLHSYELTTDWGGTLYSGMTLKWDYQKLTCDISLPGYVVSVEFSWSSHPGLLLVDPSMTRSHLQCARRPAGAHLSSEGDFQHCCWRAPL
jgi:hypothetical protein